MKNVIQGTTLSGTGAVSIAPGAEITIRNPAGQLVPLWADRAGTQPHDNPFLTDNEGNFRVYADSGWVHIRAQKNGSVREWRYVPLGSAAAMNIGEVYEALGSEIYSSVSEGLSNSAEGDYFLVESSGSLDLYRVVNGVAEQRDQGIDADAVLATRAYADGVAAEAESNATNAAVAAASAAYQQATEYSDSRLQAHRESGDHDGRYYTKTEVDHALEDKVDENDPRLSDAREWIASTVSQDEAEAGTATIRRAWTAQRVRQAIVAAYNALTSAFGRTLANASDATAARNTLGLGTAATLDVGTGSNNVVVGSDPRLSDAREWTAEVVSQAEAEAGTSTVPRKWTAERVRQAVEAALAGGAAGIYTSVAEGLAATAEGNFFWVADQASEDVLTLYRVVESDAELWASVPHSDAVRELIDRAEAAAESAEQAAQRAEDAAADTGLPSPIVPDTFLQAKADGSGYQAVDDEQMLNALGIPAGKPTADPATPITGSLLSGAMLAAGAIVEQGENANGSYWRWESGLQVCALSISLGPADTAGDGTASNPWRTVNLNLQPPAAFVGDPVLTATAARYMPIGAEAVVGAYLRKLSDGWQIQAWAASSAGSDVVAYVTAIGRWK